MKRMLQGWKSSYAGWGSVSVTIKRSLVCFVCLFFYLFHLWYPWPYRLFGWGPSKKKGLSGQVVSLWLLQEESVEKEDKISPDNPPCVSTTAWEKSSFSPRCLETLFLYVHGDTCYISGRQHEGYEAAKILTFWTTLEAIQGQMALHLKEKGDSCVFWFLHHNRFENDDQVKAILGT